MDPVHCDSCGHPFVPQLTETRVKGGAKQRFGCPSCGHIYDVAFITTTGLKLRPKVKRAAKAGDLEEHRQLLDQFQAEVTRYGGSDVG